MAACVGLIREIIVLYTVIMYMYTGTFQQTYTIEDKAKHNIMQYTLSTKNTEPDNF